MAAFPALRTGAVAQYPAEREARFSTTVLEFMDGREQRFRQYRRMLRRWVIRLDLLEEAELAAVARFFDETGPAARFSFTDPWDGNVHPNCVIESAELTAEWTGEGRARTGLVIREEGA